ncbi:Dihydrolipoamide acetyltransferase component of pyruvate dehydrogenase complex [Mycena venus]|uniref:Dihydrolipoamide acetyltransferase component of pyruvate dehydrogenase complex n=1 Tax=Mycena venus TaxID=2733690 RepID=A0A8H6Y886_9AGAR|nr:Dihydrolipoamide acetyltransferase component of pyruvate dehydrogenase complex [Mycena venus]
MFLRGIRHSPRLIARFQTRWASHKVVHTFKLADIGEGITECEVIRWSVAPRATVGAFDPLCEVQSDKASVEITSPFDGVVKELLVQEGQVAKVGQGLCTIEVDEEAVEGAEEPSAKEPPISAPSSAEEPKEAPATPAPEPAPTARRPHPMDPSFTPEKGADSSHALATPSVRHFARTQGVDLALLAPGSGKGGPPTQSGEDIIVELGRTRQAMFRAMVKSLEIPLFGYSTTLDITDLHALLPTRGATRVSRTSPFLLKTLARTMMDWPLFRSSITPPPPSSSSPSSSPSAKQSLTIRPHADIALALSTPTGLYTPLLRATDTRSIYTLASDIAHLAALGRRVPSGLTAEHLGPGTLSVSNVGAAGRGTGAAPVLVPGGGVAIVALGRAEWVWDVSDAYWEKGGGGGGLGTREEEAEAAGFVERGP